MTTTAEITQTRPPAGREVGALAWVGVQLGVILLLARAFHLESPAFYNIVLPLSAGGFLVHHWLPRVWQPWFFAALSVAGVFLIFGGVGGAWLIGIGLGLIALCHLPIAFRWRIVLILLAAAGLVSMRATWLPTPWPGVIWPILGSMFMFRLAMYLYDLKHRGPSPPRFVLSYFFLLPNTVFLLFPVIDFRTFLRTHYDKPAFDIYGEGVRWMFRGLTHLVLYRLIYQYVALSPADVTSTTTLVQYLVGNFGLLLRVSGQFHMAVGLLHLFGFRLPETHRFYYLASSFSDLWRRMNIYWKDAMQKLVFMPVVLSLTQRGQTTAVVVATACVITITWLLHSYQWFWLLGVWLLSATDMAFWAIIGVFLIASTIREQRRGRARQLTAQAPTERQAWREALQTAGMFTLMTCLWGFWTSPTFEDFRVVLRAATFRPLDVAVVVGFVFTVTLLAYLVRRFGFGGPSELTVPPRWQHPLLVAALPLALVWVAGQPGLEGRVPRQVQAVAQQTRLAELNKTDAERLQRGYYEKIVGVNRFNGELWEVYARAATTQQAEDILVGDDALEATADAGIKRFHKDALEFSLKPLYQGTFKDARFSTNRWGMRDRDYNKIPSTGTRRIAVLGQSYTMGAGVNDGETFEALVEERLNREWSPKTGLQYEALNFAASTYGLLKQNIILQNGRVGEFHPQVVLIVGNPVDRSMMAREVGRLIRKRIVLPGPIPKWLKDAGVAGETPAGQGEIDRYLQPHLNDLARWAFESMATEVRQMGAQPVWALIPMPNAQTRDTPEAAKLLISMAVDAGFLVIDMQDVYAGHDPRSLTLNEADNHPNTEGHRIIADRLYRELAALRPDILAPATPAELEDQSRRWAEWNRKQLAAQQADEARVGAEPGAPGGRTGRPLEGWAVDTREGNVATLESRRADNWMRVTIEKLASRSPSSIRLRKGPVPLIRAHRYELKFWMQADAARPVTCGLASGTSAETLLGVSTKVDAGTWWQEFSCAFKATATDPSALIFFDLGTSEAALELSRVELRDLSTGTVVMSTDRAWKPPAGGIKAP